MIVWVLCFFINTISILVAFIFIPFVFFIFGSAYLKHEDDNHHLKIHKILIFIITLSIILTGLLAVLFTFTHISVQNIANVTISINMLAVFGLFFNSWGEENIIDFIIKIFVKIKNLIKG